MASDNSWFWIYKKQTTGVSILVNTVKIKADTISSQSVSMKTTFIIEINSHPCNKYIIQNYKHQGLRNVDSVTSRSFQMGHILDKICKKI